MSLRSAVWLSAVVIAIVCGVTGAQNQVQSLHVQGNVWMLHSDVANAAVQIGPDGVLVVDTMTESLADPMLAEIRRLAPDTPIRLVINTHVHSDHTGGNAKVSGAGRTVIGGNAVAELGQAAADRAQIFAHENVEVRMAQPSDPAARPPTASWPSNTFAGGQHDLYFNGEGIELLHPGNAHTDGDTMVYFRKSDVLVAGDVYANDLFPRVDLQNGGEFSGIIKALNTLIRVTIPREKEEGGTYVIPGHGRVADEADLVEYRDMTTILRDRVADAVKRRQTLAQTQATRLTRDYDGRYGLAQGGWSTANFVEAVYQSVQASTTASSAAQPVATSPAGRK
jgi:glyoxylase-like metal-dependent hydrolase (beta-lactamase superfamily II)